MVQVCRQQMVSKRSQPHGLGEMVPWHSTNARSSVCSVPPHWPCQTGITHCAFGSCGYQIQRQLSQVWTSSTYAFHCSERKSENKKQMRQEHIKKFVKKNNLTCLRNWLILDESIMSLNTCFKMSLTPATSTVILTNAFLGKLISQIYALTWTNRSMLSSLNQWWKREENLQKSNVLWCCTDATNASQDKRC